MCARVWVKVQHRLQDAHIHALSFFIVDPAGDGAEQLLEAFQSRINVQLRNAPVLSSSTRYQQ